MKYLYYPGCSLKSTAKAFEESLLAVMAGLDVPVEELNDWNCCGSASYLAIDEKQAYALAARNLALAEEQDTSNPGAPVELMVPCAACYLVLNKAQHYIEESPEIASVVTGALADVGLKYSGRVRVRYPLDIMLNDLGLDRIKAKVQRPLKGLKVACYYGCQIMRPYAFFDDQHNPTSMDRTLAAMGADVVDWPLKIRCCGSLLTGTIEEIGLDLGHVLLKEARKRGADVIATACPLCHFNLECYQGKINHRKNDDLAMPVVFFTQLMGLAMGIPEQKLGLQRQIVPVGRVLAAVS